MRNGSIFIAPLVSFSHLLLCGCGHAILFHAVHVISIYLSYLSAYSLMSHICFIKFHPTSFTTIFPCSLFYEHIFLPNSTSLPPNPKNNIQPTPTNTEGHPLVFFRRSTGGNSRIPNAHTSGPLGTRRLAVNVVVAWVCAFVAEVKTTGFRIAMGKQQSRNLFLVDFSGFVLFLSLFGWCVFAFVGGTFFSFKQYGKEVRTSQ